MANSEDKKDLQAQIDQINRRLARIEGQLQGVQTVQSRQSETLLAERVARQAGEPKRIKR